MSAESESRRQRKHDRQKQLLLNAASRLFAEQGYNSVTVRRIAEAADCSQGMLYSYFTDKADILRHLCEETFEHLDDSLDLVAARKLPPVEHLLAASREFVRFSLDNPHHFKVFVMASTDFGDTKAVEYIGQRGLAGFLRLRAIYDAAAFPVEAPHGSFVWWNSLKGVIDFINLHRAHPWFDPVRLIDVTLETLLAGHRAAR